MFTRLMEHADRAGFDGLAVNEHHQAAFAMPPSPNLLAAALASNTENAAILVIGDSLALYNQLVESWGLGPVDVMGHSLGGMFAAEFAAICPHLTRRLVGGAEDVLTPVRQSVEMARLIPDARLVVLPRGGHAMVIEYPDDTVFVIRAFLQDG